MSKIAPKSLGPNKNMKEYSMAGVNEQVVDALTIGNVKTVGESAAFYAALSMGNEVASQNRLKILAEAALGQSLKGLQEVDPVESLSLVKAMTGSESGSSAALVALVQQLMKGAQSTPPETAK